MKSRENEKEEKKYVPSKSTAKKISTALAALTTVYDERKKDEEAGFEIAKKHYYQQTPQLLERLDDYSRLIATRDEAIQDQKSKKVPDAKLFQLRGKREVQYSIIVHLAAEDEDLSKPVSPDHQDQIFVIKKGEELFLKKNDRYFQLQGKEREPFEELKFEERDKTIRNEGISKAMRDVIVNHQFAIDGNEPDVLIQLEDKNKVIDDKIRELREIFKMDKQQIEKTCGMETEAFDRVYALYTNQKQSLENNLQHINSSFLYKGKVPIGKEIAEVLTDNNTYFNMKGMQLQKVDKKTIKNLQRYLIIIDLLHRIPDDASLTSEGQKLLAIVKEMSQLIQQYIDKEKEITQAFAQASQAGNLSATSTLDLTSNQKADNMRDLKAKLDEQLVKIDKLKRPFVEQPVDRVQVISGYYSDKFKSLAVEATIADTATNSVTSPQPQPIEAKQEEPAFISRRPMTALTGQVKPVRTSRVTISSIREKTTVTDNQPVTNLTRSLPTNSPSRPQANASRMGFFSPHRNAVASTTPSEKQQPPTESNGPKNK